MGLGLGLGVGLVTEGAAVGLVGDIEGDTVGEVGA